MVVAWRLVNARYAQTAFSGEGAAKFGGRWNSRGVPVVYASSTLSLAALEMLVHLNPLSAPAFVAFRLEFDEGLVQRLPMRKLPKDWRVQPATPLTRELGDAWARDGKLAVLQVPSAVVPGEANYLLNPLHENFRELVIGDPEPFTFDSRLLVR